MPDSAFTWPVTVYIEDTDAGGIVFYANYLRFMERARTEWVRSLGFPRLERIDECLLFVVHRATLTYHHPARLDDCLLITVNLIRLGRIYMVFEQLVVDTTSGRVLVEGEITVACVSKKEFKPKRLPERLTKAIQQGTVS